MATEMRETINGQARMTHESPARWRAAFHRAAADALDLFEVIGMPGFFAVTSSADPSLVYLATSTTCTCRAAIEGDNVCKHRAAVRAALGTLGPAPALAPVAGVMQDRPAPAVCAACHGRKTVLFGDEHHWPYEVRCPRCKGSGIAPIPKWAPAADAEPVALAAD
jgi:hypothetical protein